MFSLTTLSHKGPARTKPVKAGSHNLHYQLKELKSECVRWYHTSIVKYHNVTQHNNRYAKHFVSMISEEPAYTV